jgi:hypothetical protein
VDCLDPANEGVRKPQGHGPRTPRRWQARTRQAQLARWALSVLRGAPQWLNPARAGHCLDPCRGPHAARLRRHWRVRWGVLSPLLPLVSSSSPHHHRSYPHHAPGNP